jgi:hypothetical protein
MTNDIYETFIPDKELIAKHSKKHAKTAVITGIAAYALGSSVYQGDTDSLMSIPVAILSATAGGMSLHSLYSLGKQQLQRYVSVSVDTANKHIVRKHPVKSTEEIDYDRLLLVHRADDSLFLDYEKHVRVDDQLAKGYKVKADSVRIPLVADAEKQFERFKAYVE